MMTSLGTGVRTVGPGFVCIGTAGGGCAVPGGPNPVAPPPPPPPPPPPAAPAPTVATVRGGVGGNCLGGLGCRGRGIPSLAATRGKMRSFLKENGPR